MDKHDAGLMIAITLSLLFVGLLVGASLGVASVDKMYKCEKCGTIIDITKYRGGEVTHYVSKEEKTK